MEDWDRKLLVVTLHDAVSGPDLARRLGWMPRTCLAEERGCTSPRCSIMPLAQVVVFPSACRRRLSNGYVSWRVYLFVGSFVSSAISCPYALCSTTGHGTLAWVAEGLSKREFSRGFVPRPL